MREFTDGCDDNSMTNIRAAGSGRPREFCSQWLAAAARISWRNLCADIWSWRILQTKAQTFPMMAISQWGPPPSGKCK